METNNKFNVPHYLFPFKRHFVDLENGSRIHYVDEGDGPVLFFLHGNPTWSFMYRDMISELSERFRCIAMDLSGFGLSVAPSFFEFTAREQAEVVEDFVNELNLEDVTLVAHDWGGPIGLWVAGRNQDRFRGFVLGNTFAWPIHRFKHRLFSAIAGGFIGRFCAKAFNGVAKLLLAVGVKGEMSEEVEKMYMMPFEEKRNRLAQSVFPRELRHAWPFLNEVVSMLPKVNQMPVLLPWGMRDRMFDTHELLELKKLFPVHTVLPLDAGHLFTEKCGKEVSKAIKVWQEEISLGLNGFQKQRMVG